MSRTLLVHLIFILFTFSACAETNPYESIPKSLLTQIRQNSYIDQFITQTLQPIRQNGENGQSLSKSNIAKIEANTKAALRSGQVANILRADINGDGKVTEVEASDFSSNQNPYKGASLQNNELQQAIQRTMRFDSNKNGTVEFDEMLKLEENTNNQINNKQLAELLELDPNKDSSLTALELEDISRKAFKIVDKNNDGFISREEYEQLRKWKSEQGVSEINNTRFSHCELPKIDKKTKIILFGTYEGGAISPIAVAGQDVETTAARVTIEEGKEPIYLILSTSNSIVWQIKGAKERVSQVVLLSEKKYEGNLNQAAITGISKDKVVFIPAGDCFKYFSEKKSIEATQAAAAVKRALGREADEIFAKYETQDVIFPSGSTKVSTPTPKAPSGFDKASWQEVVRYYPEGIADIKASEVVGAEKIEPYEVLPSQAGISQLVGQGSLELLSRGDYKIVKPIPRYPTGLAGAHSVRFLLGKGVPEPKGNSGHSCVVSEETGKPIEDINCN